MRPFSLAGCLAAMPLLLALSLPTQACERHLQGHQNGGTSTSQEAGRR